MHSSGDGKDEPADPEDAVRMLEIELIRQRMARQQAGTPYRGFRAASFIFFLAVVLGVLFAFYYVFYSGGLDEVRARKTTNPNPSFAPRSSPTP